MRKFYIFLIIFSLVCALATIYISIQSENLSDNFKTFGFILVGYVGVISFTYAWISLKKLKKKDDNKNN